MADRDNPLRPRFPHVRRYPPHPPAQDSARQNVTLQIVSVVMFTFIGYLTIGIPLAVLPGYVHDDLGYGSVLAGLVISLQYLATLLARPYAGRVIDGLGPKRAVLYGMAGSAASGLFMLLSVAIQGWPALSLASLLVGRLVLGAAESLVGSAAIGWGIGRVGAPHRQGDFLERHRQLRRHRPRGAARCCWCSGWGCGAWARPSSCSGRSASPWPGRSCRRRWCTASDCRSTMCSAGSPARYGPGAGAIGFGTIATFITLYYASRGWANAVLCLSAFGGCFIGARLLFANSINRLGGFRVAIICLGVESLGLLLLWSAPNPWVGLAGAALTGFGFSLVFPAFGVEAVNLVPASNRGAALGAYSLFVDLSLGITGPLVGFVANLFGFRSMFLFACLASLGGLALAVALHRRSRPGWGVHRPRRRYAFCSPSKALRPRAACRASAAC